jgi:ubiquinone/menaquinone biosynthesis C-methylase UbiE
MTESVGQPPAEPGRSSPTSAEFDEGFTAAAESAGLRQVWQVADPELPVEIEPFSFLSAALLDHVLQAVDISPGQTLVDVACGRGGPGLWLARQSGAFLVGVDFSPVAVAQAGQRAALFGMADRARFVVGDLSATGLPDASADAVVSIDALHFATDLTAAAREAYRVVREGRRLVLTNWQPRTPGDPQLPSRRRDIDWTRILSDAGFAAVGVEARPEWHEFFIRIYHVALNRGDPGEDTALAALQDEARQRLPTVDLLDRVVVTATRPGHTEH